MNIKKISTIIILIILINTIFAIKSYALSEIISSGDSFISASDGESDNTIDATQLGKTNANIYNILLGIGVAVAVIIGAVLGIQFIFQSAEGKAKISEALVPYIVGCFVVFGAFGIWKIAINAGQSINAEGTTSSLSEGKLETFNCKECGEKIELDSGKVRALQNGQVTLTCKNGHTYKYP